MTDQPSTQEEPFLVPQGWADAEFIANPGGDSYRLLFYRGAGIRFEHRCDRGERGVVICAPRLQHEVRMRHSGVTVNPSILCPDCGTHGFIRDSRWVAA